MQLLSVNIGKIKPITWRNKTVNTAITKEPSQNICKVSIHGIEGDEQADRKHHGGETKALYSYDISYYEIWKKKITRADWPYGIFGENLTTQGLLDKDVKIGNVYKIGSTLIKAMEPRFPCSRLNAQFQLANMVTLFSKQEGHGIYFKVIQEGEIQKNNTIELIESPAHNITIANIVEAYYAKGKDNILLHNILEIPYLPKNLRKNLEAFI